VGKATAWVAELRSRCAAVDALREYRLQHTSVAERTVLAALDVTVRLYPVSTTPRSDVTALKPTD
jgi:hypothetical protein